MSTQFNGNELLFLYELLMGDEEKGFFTSLLEDPKNKATRNAYSDWLLEKGRTESSELVKKGHTPGGMDSYSNNSPLSSGYYPPLLSGSLTIPSEPSEVGSWPPHIDVTVPGFVMSGSIGGINIHPLFYSGSMRVDG